MMGIIVGLMRGFRNSLPAVFLLIFSSGAKGQTTLYSEAFGTNSITNNCGSWSTNYAPEGTKDDFFQTNGSRMEAKDVDGMASSEVIWYSESINIAGQTNVTISGTFGWSGSMSSSEYIKAYYKINGGAEVLWFDGTDDTWSAGVKSVSSLTGNTLQIVIRAWNTGASDIFYFDGLSVSDAVNGSLWSEAFGTNNLSSNCSKWWTHVPFAGWKFWTVSNKMEAMDLDEEAKWESATVSISGYLNVTISADFEHANGLSSSDYIKAYYSIDGGAETLWFDGTDDTWSSGSTQTINGLSGNTIKVIIRVYMTGSSDIYRFDNVTITGCSGASTNYSFTATGISLCNDITTAKSSYTFTQTNNANCLAKVNSGVTVTVNFPAGTDATPCTGGTFNGTTISSYTVVSATQITFTTPVSVDQGAAFSIVLNNIINGNISGGNATVSMPNISGGTNSYSTYTFSTASAGGATNYTFTSPSVSLSSPNGRCLADYTFTQTIPNKAAFISSGATVTVNFMAGTDATTMTAGTFNGTAINMGTVTKSATQVTFTAPTSSPGCSGSSFTFVLEDIKNPGWGAGSGNASVSVPNITSGTDSYSSYSYTIANQLQAFQDDPNAGTTDYTTANGAGRCFNNLTAGNTYCFNYVFPASGNITTRMIVDPGATACGSTSIMTSSSVGGGCASVGTANFNQYSLECTWERTGMEVGGGCPQTSGEYYTVCYTVPAGCTGIHICPLIYCSAGTCGGGGSLPIELLYFSAGAEGEKVGLQ